MKMNANEAYDNKKQIKQTRRAICFSDGPKFSNCVIMDGACTCETITPDMKLDTGSNEMQRIHIPTQHLNKIYHIVLLHANTLNELYSNIQ